MNSSRSRDHTKGPDFLIVGLQKAGTYWLTNLLDAHTDVSCFPVIPKKKGGVGEVFFFNVIAEAASGNYKNLGTKFFKGYLDFFRDLVPLYKELTRDEFLERCKERYNEWCRIWKRKKLVGEKIYNYVLYLDLIDSCYPGIRKICVLRNPKDRITSYFFHKNRKTTLLRNGRSNNNISDDFVKWYVARIRKEYEILRAYSGQLYCLRYESLLRFPHETLRGLLRYLEVDSRNAVLEKMIREADFQKLKLFEQYLGKRVVMVQRLARSIFKRVMRNSAAIRYACTISDIWLHSERRVFGVLYPLLRRRRSIWQRQTKLAHFRKGVSGDWRNHLTEEQSEYIDSELSELEREVFGKYDLAHF